MEIFEIFSVSVVVAFLGSGFLGMILAVYTLAKYPAFEDTKEKLATLFLIVYVGTWWTALLWLIFKTNTVL